MKKVILTMIVMLIGASAGMAQFGSATDAATLAFNPQEIADDFKDRMDNPEPSNAFVDVFFADYSVPQQPQTGVSMLDTWVSWATNHPAAVEEYLIRRKSNHDVYHQ